MASRNTIEKFMNMIDFNELEFTLYNNSVKVIDVFGKLRGIIKDVSLVRNMGPHAWYEISHYLKDDLQLNNNGPDIAGRIVYETSTSKYYYYNSSKKTFYTMEQLKKLDMENKL